MKKSIYLALLIIILAPGLRAQNDTIKLNNLLEEILLAEKDSVPLIPNKFPFTQRVLWGKKGLMRNFNAFELTPAKREEELKIRRTMLAAHQVLGFVTLGGMVAQGIVGSRLYSGNATHNLHQTHENLALGINICYFTTASLSLFSPPKMLDERKGYSSIKLHKALAFVHLSGLIATNILAGQLESNPDLRPWHRAAAFTTFGAFAASMIVIKF